MTEMVKQKFRGPRGRFMTAQLPEDIQVEEFGTMPKREGHAGRVRQNNELDDLFLQSYEESRDVKLTAPDEDAVKWIVSRVDNSAAHFELGRRIDTKTEPGYVWFRAQQKQRQSNGAA